MRRSARAGAQLQLIVLFCVTLATVSDASSSGLHLRSASTEGQCSLVGVPREEQCALAQSKPECSDDGLVAYTRMYACSGLSPASAMLLLALWASLLFLVLTAVADKLFAPSLEHVASALCAMTHPALCQMYCKDS
jgi:hypothetical protein